MSAIVIRRIPIASSSSYAASRIRSSPIAFAGAGRVDAVDSLPPESVLPESLLLEPLSVSLIR